ncbi:hypothetical protein T4A_13321 [Trichinella pseudospiralis]|uniref:Uncharacterized protein n=1 Tax=Trichinella pseudospiralis TaxID=6337 RepID=A0A0V1ER83_TRIPS|nr:hypothetical protein T4A_13321 [Trichinella pseudospiralis]
MSLFLLQAIGNSVSQFLFKVVVQQQAIFVINAFYLRPSQRVSTKLQQQHVPSLTSLLSLQHTQSITEVNHTLCKLSQHVIFAEVVRRNEK